jgi:serine/threonine-protein kinase
MSGTGSRVCVGCATKTEAAVCPACQGATTPAKPGAAEGTDLVGRVLADRYQLTGVLGRGGMGVVYRGVQLAVDRPVAIKVVSRTLAKDPRAVQRFQREAKVSSKLQHPNAIRVYDFGLTDDGLLFLVMELLDGRELSRELKALGRLPVHRAVNIAVQALKALHEAHGYGIVHRDLKPSNVFLQDLAGETDIVKVMDFGIAKMVHGDGAELTNVGLIVGTPTYMSPEQIRGWQVDARSDLYALGVILFEMVAGRVPFRGDSQLAVMVAHTREPPPPVSSVVEGPGVEALDGVLARLLAKEPADRPASALHAMALLHRLLPALAPLSQPDLASLSTAEFLALERDRQVPAPGTPTPMPRPAPGGGPPADPVVHDEATVADPGGPGPVAPRRARAVTVVVGLAAAALGLGGYLALRPDSPPPVAAEPPSTAAPAETPPPAPPPQEAPATLPPRVTLRFVSSPPGARVFLAGRDLGVTPLSHDVDQAAEPLGVEATKDGFTPQGRQVTPRESQEVRLDLLPAARAPAVDSPGRRGKVKPTPKKAKPSSDLLEEL